MFDRSFPSDCAIPIRTASLDSVGIDAWGIFGGELAESALLTAVKVDVFDVEGVNVTWDISEDGETDVDEEVGTAARDHKYTDRGQEEGDEHNENGRRCVRHCVWSAVCFSRDAIV